jgi:hypothetical protein
MSHTVLLPDDLRQQITRVATDLCYCSERLDCEPIRNGHAPDTDERATLHETERELLAPLLTDDFAVVGVGVARCVLRFPAESALSEYVVKLARFGDDPFSAGFIQNKRETLIWHRHGQAGDWSLLPVVDHHQQRFRWLVMPYGDPLTDRPKDERRTFVQQARGELAMLPFNLQEIRADNFIIIDDEPLLADYGRPDGV